METLLKELIEALKVQTEAVNALAASNLELVQVMTQAEDLPAEPTRYLDGTKR